MSDKNESFHSGTKIGGIFIEGETLILDFENKQYQLASSFMDEVVEHAEVIIDKGKYR